MIELGSTPQAAPPAADLIKDATDATFIADVVEMSKTIPVITDFRSARSGLSKTMTPALEAAVTKAKGAVRLVKIDVDANPGYAGQLQVQSIPTVYAFWQGQPVDGFQDPLTPAQIDTFVAKIAAMGPGAEDEGLAEAVLAAQAMLDEGEAADAAETFAAILLEEPENAAAYAGLVRSHIALGDLDQAEAILNGAPAAIATGAEMDAAHAQLALARQSANAGPVAELAAAVEADPDNHQARFDLATALHANGKTDAAVDTLLDLFRRDREWNDGAAKAQLFQIFDALPAKDPIVLSGRRRLSSMIFV